MRLPLAVPIDAVSRRESLFDDGEQRIAEREQHREADADDERGVDQAEQQEHLGLQLRRELGLAGGGFEEAAAHDAHADAGAGGADADHETDADAGVGLDLAQPVEFVHRCSFPEAGLDG